MKKLKKRLRPSRQSLKPLEAPKNAPELKSLTQEATTTGLNSSETAGAGLPSEASLFVDSKSAFDDIVKKSRDNIASHDTPKRGRGRPKKLSGPSDQGPERLGVNDGAGAASDVARSSGIPSGTFASIWGAIGNALHKRTGVESYRLDEEKKNMLDASTEKVAAKYFPLESIDDRPIAGLILTVCAVFGPPSFEFFTRQRELKSQNVSQPVDQKPQSFPIEKFN